ncbi:MAG: DUF3078 domain-containing protein [Chitinophagaceae bacterium]
MRKLFLLFSGVLLAAVTLGQDAQKKSSKWERGASLSVHVGQGGSRNWAVGAEKFSLWTGASLNIYANKKLDKSFKCYWDNNLQLNYGVVNTHSGGVRKIDDKIDLTIKPGLSLGSKAGLALLLNLRTQFSDGYNYNYLNQGLKRKISSFMAPGYVHIAPGFDWKPSGAFSLLLAPAAGKLTVVTNKPYSYSFQGGIIPEDNREGTFGEFEAPLAVNYGVDPQREVRFEVGAFVSANFTKEVVKNVFWKSKLDLFSGYTNRTEFFGVRFASQRKVEEFHPERVDVYWTNTLQMKVNKFLDVSWDFDVVYDDDVRMFGPSGDVAALQFRSMLGVGVGVIAKF